MDIQDSVVLVTGANRGIGKAYAEAFLKEGARKVYLGVRDPDSVKDMVAANPEKFVPLQLDVTQPEQIEAAAATADDVTILVNNAGVLFMDSVFGDGAIDNARREMEVNYFGPLAVSRAFAPVLKANGGGCLATVASIASHLCFPGIPTYSTSKAAVHSLVTAMRMELAGQGTQVVGIYPGPIDTDMTRNIEMEKSPPGQVAAETIRAIRENREDVFPDQVSQDLYQQVRQDPKAAEKNMREQYRQEAA